MSTHNVFVISEISEISYLSLPQCKVPALNYIQVYFRFKIPNYAHYKKRHRDVLTDKVEKNEIIAFYLYFDMLLASCPAVLLFERLQLVSLSAKERH